MQMNQKGGGESWNKKNLKEQARSVRIQSEKQTNAHLMVKQTIASSSTSYRW